MSQGAMGRGATSEEWELLRTLAYALKCDGKSHWITPANVSSWGIQRIEAGACNCVKGAEGDDAEGQAGKDPAPRSPLVGP
jgi:hypothetical protein